MRHWILLAMLLGSVAVGKANSVLERPLPHSAEAERSVLGAILLDNKALDDAGELRAADFFLDQHRKVYARMLEMHERQEPVELVTLTDVLIRTGELEAVGGPAYVANLMDGMPKISNVAAYAKIVREKSALRDAIHTANAAMEKALTGEGTAEEIIGSACDVFGQLAIEVAGDHGLKSYRDAAMERVSDMVAEADGDTSKQVRIYSGIDKLDKLTGGGRKGELWVITASTGVGKTFLSSQVRDKACEGGWHGLYCSAEMFASHLAGREIATKAEVPHWKLRRPESLSVEEFNALREAADHQCTRCHIMEDEISIRRIRMAARRLKRAGQCHLVVVDYDELIEAPGKDENEQQKNLVRGLKAMAIEIECPVFMVSQLRKTLDKADAKRPSLERIYGSGAKTKHASFVLFVNREYVRELTGDETEAQIFVLKSRDTRAGRLDAKFNIKSLRFENSPKEDEQPRKRSKKHAAGPEEPTIFDGEKS